LTTDNRQLLIASPRGFCAGVVRAIDVVEQLLAAVGTPLYVRKEIVHNQAVVADFRRRGVVFVDDLEEVPDGGTVVFSAHGISPEVQQVLIGHAGHDEVLGTMGEAPDKITLVTDIGDVATLSYPPGTEVAYVTQTTLSVDETRTIVNALKRRFPDLIESRKSDICYATQNRQDAVKALTARGATHLLVVGSRNSSNSRRLCEVARNEGATASLVDGPQDIDLDLLQPHTLLGLTAGASAPEHLVREVETRLAAAGWEPQQVVSMVENVRFELPRGLPRPTIDE